MMHSDPELAHTLLRAMAESVATYACHQAHAGVLWGVYHSLESRARFRTDFISWGKRIRNSRGDAFFKRGKPLLSMRARRHFSLFGATRKRPLSLSLFRRRRRKTRGARKNSRGVWLVRRTRSGRSFSRQNPLVSVVLPVPLLLRRSRAARKCCSSSSRGRTTSRRPTSRRSRSPTPCS